MEKMEKEDREAIERNRLTSNYVGWSLLTLLVDKNILSLEEFNTIIDMAKKCAGISIKANKILISLIKNNINFTKDELHDVMNGFLWMTKNRIQLGTDEDSSCLMNTFI